MDKWADYCVSKLSFDSKNEYIDTVILITDQGESLKSLGEKKRDWLIKEANSGKTFCTIKKNEKGNWNKLGSMEFNGTIFSWDGPLPANLPNRKTFVSYYHKDDEEYRIIFDNLFDDLLTCKSVADGDIDSDNSDAYAKQLIQNNYLNDTTILVVLIGENAKCRKHVDWEIYGALDYKVGDKYAGLLGLFLPTHPSYGKDTYSKESIPERLQANVNSGYAIVRDWTDNRQLLQEYIELAIANREFDDKIINKSIKQLTKNLCE